MEELREGEKGTPQGDFGFERGKGKGKLHEDFQEFLTGGTSPFHMERAQALRSLSMRWKDYGRRGGEGRA